VEGAWELVAAALVAFMTIQLTGVERRVVEKWLYVELGLFLFTGIAGTGHHYYWVAAPKYWLWVGGIFSSLEPLPVLLMLVDTWRHMHESRRPLRPRLTWVFLFGMAVLHFVGAGAFGMAHTLPQINYYTHGSQVTVSHGHLAFYGAYVLLNLSFFYFALPRLRRFPSDEYRARLGHWAFWVMSVSLLGMSLAFAVAGVLQSYLERAQALPYMVAQRPIRFWMLVAFAHGIGVLLGAAMAIVHLLTLRPAASPAPGEAVRAA
jgi:nitric oxide reductase subunit B